MILKNITFLAPFLFFSQFGQAAQVVAPMQVCAESLMEDKASAIPSSPYALTDLKDSDYDDLIVILRDPDVVSMSGDDLEDDEIRSIFSDSSSFALHENSWVTLVAAIRDTKTAKVIGIVHAYHPTPDGSVSLGVVLQKSYWRKGIMSSALIEISKFLFENTKYKRIETAVVETNLPSIALLNKLGFVKIGVRATYAETVARPGTLDEIYELRSTK
jgi:[ribosomal protein S5]-alanine N-acetyltransferase